MTEKQAIEVIKQTPLMRYIVDLKHKGELGEALEMAVQALERMMPKKPDFSGLYACPSCKTILLYGAFEAKGECCKYCGQRLDWGE